jgi:hypothetical protein
MSLKLTIRRRSAGTRNPILGFVTDEGLQEAEEALDIDGIYEELGLVQVLADFSKGGPILVSETKEGDVEEYLRDQDVGEDDFEEEEDEVEDDEDEEDEDGLR